MLEKNIFSEQFCFEVNPCVMSRSVGHVFKQIAFQPQALKKMDYCCGSTRFVTKTLIQELNV